MEIRMTTITLTSPVASEKPQDHRDESSPYAPPFQTAALLRSGAQYRRDRIEAADMISTDEASELTGTNRVTINAWIKRGRVIGVEHLRRGFKLPQWQFEPVIFPLIQPIAKCLGTNDGWQLLDFLETSSPSLDGLTPRSAIEQGVSGERILALATAEAH
jgi:hypothetical protein